MEIQKKKIIVFDLDGTLAESKTILTPSMVAVLAQLCGKKKVAVISGAAFPQFEKQLLAGFIAAPKVQWENLFLLPTCGARFYRHEKGIWKEVYGKTLLSREKEKIFASFAKAFLDIRYEHPQKTYGDIFEDRGTQITFSALGQYTPLSIKNAWDPDQKKRLAIQAAVAKYIPEFEVRIGGTTSIDVTHKGIDKAYGIMQIEKLLGIPRDEILFVGDALFENGNDYPVKKLGVDCIAVNGPKETEKFINEWISEKA